LSFIHSLLLPSSPLHGWPLLIFVFFVDNLHFSWYVSGSQWVYFWS